MSELREKIEEAWWKIAADNKYGLKIMPTPKHHLNLVGDKQKFLDAAIEAVKVHIEGCEVLENPHPELSHRLVPLTEMSGTANLRLSQLTTKEEAWEFSNINSATARRGAFNMAIDADRKALMESLG